MKWEDELSGCLVVNGVWDGRGLGLLLSDGLWVGVEYDEVDDRG